MSIAPILSRKTCFVNLLNDDVFFPLKLKWTFSLAFKEIIPFLVANRTKNVVHSSFYILCTIVFLRTNGPHAGHRYSLNDFHSDYKRFFFNIFRASKILKVVLFFNFNVDSEYAINYTCLNNFQRNFWRNPCANSWRNLKELLDQCL